MPIRLESIESILKKKNYRSIGDGYQVRDRKYAPFGGGNAEDGKPLGEGSPLGARPGH